MKKIIAVSVIVFLLIGMFCAWHLLNRDDSLPVSTNNINSRAQSKALINRDTPDGSWTIRQQDDVFVGYEIEQFFAGHSIGKTLSGKSTAVSGSFTLKGNSVTKGIISLDLASIEDESSGETAAMIKSILETDKYPQVNFVQDEPFIIYSSISKNKQLTLDLRGKLNVHGVSKEVTLPLKAKWDGKVIAITGELTVRLDDFNIKPPQHPFTSLSDTGKLKLQVLFVPKK